MGYVAESLIPLKCLPCMVRAESLIPLKCLPCMVSQSGALDFNNIELLICEEQLCIGHITTPTVSICNDTSNNLERSAATLGYLFPKKLLTKL